MCLLLIAHQASAHYPLIVAGNRDEFHRRPAQDAHWWPDKTKLLGGRDEQAGGTWLAIHRDGRFAAVTNFRDAVPTSGKLRSRGHLITEFLESDLAPRDYLRGIEGDRYAGFNLLVADCDELGYLSNRGLETQILPPGIYGVANATLDTPWAKVVRSKAALSTLIADGRSNETNLLQLLADREKASTSEIEIGELSFERAHAMSAPFIVQPDYGTRCSSILLRDQDGRVRFTEVRYRPDGEPAGRSEFRFVVAD
jgi:uncharacterized protein with NRDE domain